MNSATHRLPSSCLPKGTRKGYAVRSRNVPRSSGGETVRAQCGEALVPPLKRTGSMALLLVGTLLLGLGLFLGL